MKKITTEIKNKDGKVRTISVYVDDETAAALECCDEEIRRFYILEEYKEFNRTRSETRRHFSFEELTEEFGNEPCSHDETLDDWYTNKRCCDRLYKAMGNLTDKQYKVLWLIAVDKLTYCEVGEKMGLHWTTVKEHYLSAIKKVKKFF